MRSHRATTAFGVFALLLMLLYIARTQPMIGPRVAKMARAEAAERGADLQIGSLAPSGLWGIAFHDVSLRVPRGKFAIEMHFDDVTVSPAWSSLFAVKPELGSVTASHGRIRLRPWKMTRQPAPGTHPSRQIPSAPRARATAKRRPLDMTLVDVEIDGIGPLQTTAPIKIGRADFKYHAGRVHDLTGYGTLPDGVYAAARTDETRDGSRTFIKLDRPTQLDDWLSGGSPIHASISGFRICATCDEVVGVTDVVLSPSQWRKEVKLVTPFASLTRSGGVLELNAAEFELENASKVGFGARIMRTRLEFDAQRGAMRVRSRLVDPEGGSLDVDATWDKAVDATFFADHFDSTSVAKFIEIDRLKLGTVDGTMRANVDLDEWIVDLETAIRLRQPTISISRLSKEPLTFPALGITMHALVDIKGRAFSVASGRITLGAAAQMGFRGELIDAGKGWRFDAHLKAQKVDAVSFRDGLPTGIREVAEGAILDGDFSFTLDVSGHTAYPDSLKIDGTLDGDVKVLRDGQADVRSLITNGAPPQLKRASLDVWRSYEDLPAHVPRVLLAAEDAAFFGHPGFDWAGLRAAMVHNIEAGSLERGGSTISQQVVKNLFLTPERTVARKLQEAYLTWRMESEVPKERILEIYLNLADWGGVVGIERAAQRYFRAAADQLSVPEVAMLAAILPNPTRFGSKIRKGIIDRGRAEKIQRILNNLRFLGDITMQDYLTWNAAVARGQVGRLTLTIE